MTDHHTIVITVAGQPDPERYAAAVLGCHTVLQLAGLGDIATVWQDQAVVTDQQMVDLTDRWADTNPWA